MGILLYLSIQTRTILNSKFCPVDYFFFLPVQGYSSNLFYHSAEVQVAFENQTAAGDAGRQRRCGPFVTGEVCLSGAVPRGADALSWQHHRSGLCRRVARYREGAIAGLFGVADRRDFAEVPLVALPGLVHLRIARLLIVLGRERGGSDARVIDRSLLHQQAALLQ